MKKLLIIGLTIIMLTFGFLGCTNKDYTKISSVEGKQKIDNGGVIIVDVREEYEYNEGHIEGAILLPLGQIDTETQSVLPDKNATIIIYCRSGNRSATAAKKMVSLGYLNIYDMGGIIEWINQGYNTVK